MELESKRVEFKIDSVTEEGVFTGYASVFKNVDLGGDIVEQGAFTKTLFEQGAKRPLYRSHRIPIGVAELEQDDVGLRVTKGILNLNKQDGRDSYQDMLFYREHGITMGMSFGYHSIPKRTTYDNDGVRHLHEVRLHEVTLDEIPMNPAARVADVKSLLEELKAGRRISAATRKHIEEAIAGWHTAATSLQALLDEDAVDAAVTVAEHSSDSDLSCKAAAVDTSASSAAIKSPETDALHSRVYDFFSGWKSEIAGTVVR